MATQFSFSDKALQRSISVARRNIGMIPVVTAQESAAMTVAFDLPAEAEEALRHEGTDANAAAREAVLVELYRRHRLTHFQLSRALGLSRSGTDGILKKHDVTEDLPNLVEFRREAESLRKGV
jgi:hypothetical protein